MWPVRHPLQEGELLSTWMARTGAALGLHARELYALEGAGRTNFDVDSARDLAAIVEISRNSGVEYARLLRATMSRYDGLVFETRLTFHARQWVVTSGLTKFQAPGGYPVCLRCLASEPIPYFRSSWRLICCPLCELHGCLLVTSCQRCGAAIRPWAYAVNDSIPNFPYCFCHSCGADLRDQQAPIDSQISDALLAHVVSQIDSGVISGVSSGLHQYSLLFFQGWGICIALLASRMWGPKIFSALQTEMRDLDPIHTSYSGSIGALEPAARLNLCSSALRLLEKWPERFIRICSDVGIRTTNLEILRGGIPFWMASGIGGALDPRYRPNRDEILSAAAELSKTTAYPNRHKLEIMIGVVENKHIDQQLKPLRSTFSRREIGNFFKCFDQEIAATPLSKGRKYRLARDRTIIVMVCLGGYDLQDVCSWTWDCTVMRRLRGWTCAVGEDPPPILASSINRLKDHIHWFVSRFPPAHRNDGDFVFKARGGRAIDVESVRITAGQIKKRACLQRVATCITGITLRAAPIE